MLLKNKVKEPYLDSAGKVIPSVTEIIGILNKPSLMGWAWSVGRRGLTLDKAREHSIDVGNLAHYYVECLLKGIEPAVEDSFSEQDKTKALGLVELFKQYYDQRVETLIASEWRIINHHLLYGGTLDIVVKTKEGHNEIWDLKTSGAIWPEYYIQLAAYKHLLMGEGMYATARILLMTKKGWFDAPDIPEETMLTADECWWSLHELYPNIKLLRELSEKEIAKK